MKKFKVSVLVATASLVCMTFAGCAGDGEKTTDVSTETSDTLVSTTSLETSTTITTSEPDKAKDQEGEFSRYLKDLYNNADEYAKGYPQKVSGADEGFASAVTYLKYAIADFNGDGKTELITVESNNFPVESGNTAKNIDKGYLTFRMYRTNDGGGIVENEKINGLSNGVSFKDYEKNLKCYDNGIVAIDQTAAVNAAWGYDNKEVKAFLYFDDEIVKKLDVTAINEYLDSDWAQDNSSYVLMQISEDGYEICLGGAQDSYTDMTKLTKEQYDGMVKILTDAKEVDVEFKDINKENLGI